MRARRDGVRVVALGGESSADEDEPPLRNAPRQLDEPVGALDAPNAARPQDRAVPWDLCTRDGKNSVRNHTYRTAHDAFGQASLRLVLHHVTVRASKSIIVEDAITQSVNQHAAKGEVRVAPAAVDEDAVMLPAEVRGESGDHPGVALVVDVRVRLAQGAHDPGHARMKEPQPGQARAGTERGDSGVGWCDVRFQVSDDERDVLAGGGQGARDKRRLDLRAPVARPGGGVVVGGEVQRDDADLHRRANCL